MTSVEQAQRGPDYRAVFDGDGLTLIAYEPWMPRASGGAGMAFRCHAERVIADFYIVGRAPDLELIVEEITGAT